MLFENLEKKVFKKFELVDEKEGRLVEQVNKAKSDLDQVLTSFEVLSTQEKYIMEKQHKYKQFMEKLKENTNEKLEKLKQYCEDTYSKQKTKLLGETDNKKSEGTDEYGGLNREEIFFLEIQKKMKENDKNIRNLTT